MPPKELRHIVIALSVRLSVPQELVTNIFYEKVGVCICKHSKYRPTFSILRVLKPFWDPLSKCLCILLDQSSRKRRITRIGTHVFPLGRMIFARRESRVRMFFFACAKNPVAAR